MIDNGDPLVDAIVDLLTDSSIVVRLRSLFGLPTWVKDRESDDLFRLETQPEPLPALDSLGELKASEAWFRAERALRADGLLGIVADRLVGDRTIGFIRIDAVMTLAKLIAASASTGADRTAVETVVERERSRFRTTRFTYNTVAPLVGLTTTDTVTLDAEVAIRQMSDEEVVLCLNAGFFRPALPTLPFAHVKRTAIVVGQASQWRALTSEELEAERAPAPNETVEPSPVDVALASIRLNYQHPIGLLGRATAYPNGVTQYSFTGPWAHTPDAGVEITNAMADRLRATFSHVRAAMCTPIRPVQTALHRLAAAAEPQDAEDRIIDIFIALEALLTPGSRSELSYRLATNGANYATWPGFSRRDIFEWLRKAYEVRSGIVHGSRYKVPARMLEDGLLGLDGVAADLWYFVRLVIDQAVRSRAQWSTDSVADCERLSFAD